MIEGRGKTSRPKTLKGATIVFNNGRASFRCISRNGSDSGEGSTSRAFLECLWSSHLYLATAGPSREYVVKWRNPSTLGVEFKAAETSKADGPE
jgi:hypothetical protein